MDLYENYPLYELATPIVLTIEPGEILLLPAGWFHHVNLITPSLSVAFQIKPDKLPDLPLKMMWNQARG
jgi:hypothetical protein